MVVSVCGVVRCGGARSKLERGVVGRYEGSSELLLRGVFVVAAIVASPRLSVKQRMLAQRVLMRVGSNCWGTRRIGETRGCWKRQRSLFGTT